MTKTGRTNWTSDLNVERLRAIEVLIRQKPMGTHEIATALGIGQKSVAVAIKHLRNGVHIAGYDQRNGGIPLYAWGAGKDAVYKAVRPKPPTRRLKELEPYNSRIPRRDPRDVMFFGEAGA